LIKRFDANHKRFTKGFQFLKSQTIKLGYNDMTRVSDDFAQPPRAPRQLDTAVITTGQRLGNIRSQVVL
jgi:hypothetical protein